MKKLTALILAVVGVLIVGGSAIADEKTYVPWTFDDFNSNCEVIETAGVQTVELSPPAVENAYEEEPGELGW
jgi:hypothetical protein